MFALDICKVKQLVITDLGLANVVAGLVFVLNLARLNRGNQVVALNISGRIILLIPIVNYSLRVHTILSDAHLKVIEFVIQNCILFVLFLQTAVELG